MFVEVPVGNFVSEDFKRAMTKDLKKRIREAQNQIKTSNHYQDIYWLKGKVHGYKEALEILKDGY